VRKLRPGEQQAAQPRNTLPEQRVERNVSLAGGWIPRHDHAGAGYRQVHERQQLRDAVVDHKQHAEPGLGVHQVAWVRQKPADAAHTRADAHATAPRQAQQAPRRSVLEAARSERPPNRTRRTHVALGSVKSPMGKKSGATPCSSQMVLTSATSFSSNASVQRWWVARAMKSSRDMGSGRAACTTSSCSIWAHRVADRSCLHTGHHT